MKVTALMLFTAICTCAYSQATPDLTLAGFFIGQGDYAMKECLGEPHEISSDDGATNWAYHLDANTIEVFTFLPSRPGIVYSIQVTGEKSDKMSPFRGLRLGARTGDIFAAVGSPTSRTTLKFGTPSEPTPQDSQQLNYDTANYSFIIQDDRLVSIKLTGLNGFGESPPDLAPPFWLVRAFQMQSYNFFMLCLMPDLEIRRNGGITRIEEPFMSFIANEQSPIFKLLVSDAMSLRNVLSEYSFGDPKLRIDDGQMTIVYDGEEKNPISELIFTFWAGQYRLWKVNYR